MDFIFLKRKNFNSRTYCCEIVFFFRSSFHKVSGHCFRHKELLAGELVLWEPTHGRRGRGRPSATFIDTLKRDLGTDDKLELEVCMTNQEDLRARRAARLRPP